jgi:hypothetical protein
LQINQPTIRSTGLSLYTSLLRSEYEDTGALVAMEKATINTLDRLLNDSGAEPAIVDTYRTFYTQMYVIEKRGEKFVLMISTACLRSLLVTILCLFVLRNS